VGIQKFTAHNTKEVKLQGKKCYKNIRCDVIVIKELHDVLDSSIYNTFLSRISELKINLYQSITQAQIS